MINTDKNNRPTPKPMQVWVSNRDTILIVRAHSDINPTFANMSIISMGHGVTQKNLSEDGLRDWLNGEHNGRVWDYVGHAGYPMVLPYYPEEELGSRVTALIRDKSSGLAHDKWLHYLHSYPLFKLGGEGADTPTFMALVSILDAFEKGLEREIGQKGLDERLCVYRQMLGAARQLLIETEKLVTADSLDEGDMRANLLGIVASAIPMLHGELMVDFGGNE